MIYIQRSFILVLQSIGEKWAVKILQSPRLCFFPKVEFTSSHLNINRFFFPCLAFWIVWQWKSQLVVTIYYYSGESVFHHQIQTHFSLWSNIKIFLSTPLNLGLNRNYRKWIVLLLSRWHSQKPPVIWASPFPHQVLSLSYFRLYYRGTQSMSNQGHPGDL